MLVMNLIALVYTHLIVKVTVPVTYRDVDQQGQLSHPSIRTKTLNWQFTCLVRSHSRVSKRSKIGLPVRVGVKIFATVQGRPLRLLLEEAHSLDILQIYRQPLRQLKSR
jgi:hypothetical protein